MAMRCFSKTFGSLAAALLFVILPQAALAATAIAEDIAYFRQIFDLERLVGPEDFASEKARKLDPALRACLVDRTNTVLGEHLDRELAAVLTHEAVAQWRESAATLDGRKPMAYLTSSGPPDLATFQATLAEAEREAVSRFMHSPAFAVVAAIPTMRTDANRKALTHQVVQECNAPPGASAR